jgi:Pyruvate/2-oxoacid:ferredoxin oxidoreductase delta subunit
MSLKEEPSIRVVLYEGSGSRPWSGEERFELLSALLEKGYPVSLEAEPERMRGHGRQVLLVLGRFDGQLSARSGLGDGCSAHFRDAGDLKGAEVVVAIEEMRASMQVASPGAWKPWFPVIDYERCTNCMQCLSFCLFGVYGVDDEHRITVQTSENCKTNCPACSRVCPEAAIIFPKYKSGPINGDAVSDADVQREKMKIDISALLGGDVYSMLRQRSERAQSRFSKERDSDKALEERKKCLAKLIQAADIPPEVLMSLPAPDEIARRAQEAKARVQAAQQGMP